MVSQDYRTLQNNGRVLLNYGRVPQIAEMYDKITEMSTNYCNYFFKSKSDAVLSFNSGTAMENTEEST